MFNYVSNILFMLAFAMIGFHPSGWVKSAPHFQHIVSVDRTAARQPNFGQTALARVGVLSAATVTSTAGVAATDSKCGVDTAPIDEIPTWDTDCLTAES